MKTCVHFVGFRDPQQVANAVRVFGQPDFVHHVHDHRARADFAPGDTVVFGGKARPDFVTPFSFDDSNQP